MAEPGISGEEEPFLQPRLVRFLKNRTKLVGGSFRNDFWEEVERNVTERRKPDTAAERFLDRIGDEMRSAGFPVMKDRVRNRMARANEGALRRL